VIDTKLFVRGLSMFFSRMRVLLILYCIIAVSESSDRRSPLKRSRGSELPRVFEEEFEEAEDGVPEYKIRDTHVEDDSPTISPAATYRPQSRLPSLGPSSLPSAIPTKVEAPGDNSEVLEDGYFFFDEIEVVPEQEPAKAHPVESFSSPSGSLGSIRRSVKSFDFSQLSTVLASGNF
jgi:hypothetical protein